MIDSLVAALDLKLQFAKRRQPLHAGGIAVDITASCIPSSAPERLVVIARDAQSAVAVVFLIPIDRGILLRERIAGLPVTVRLDGVKHIDNIVIAGAVIGVHDLLGDGIPERLHSLPDRHGAAAIERVRHHAITHRGPIFASSQSVADHPVFRMLLHDDRLGPEQT